MIHFDNQRLLKAMIKLTSQREQESLAAALAEAIYSLTETSNVKVYALGGDLGKLSARVLASNNIFEPIGAHITPLESHRGMKACIEGKHPVITETDSCLQMIYPVLDQGMVTGLMMHDCPVEGDPEHDLVSSLVNIYANQHSLINHQQRDGLTGLFNRSALQSWLGKAMSDDEHGDRRLNDESSLGCLALFDIDYFKRINDSRGHLYGDEVLVTFADLMRESFRFNDLLFRYGGEEFVAILNDTELEAALSVLERFRGHVAQHKFTQINQVTVTIGVSRILPHYKPDTLLSYADKALYYGKENGRDQVTAYEWLQQGNIIPVTDEALSKNISLI